MDEENKSGLERIVGSESNNRMARLKGLILGKIPAVSLAVTNALLAAPGNPLYTPPAVGIVTYILADSAKTLFVRDRKVKKERTAEETSSEVYNRLFRILKTPFAIGSGLFGFAVSIGVNFGQSQEALDNGYAETYSLLYLLSDIKPDMAYGIINFLGAYVLLSGLERLLHSDSRATLKYAALRTFYGVTRQNKKAAEQTERLLTVTRSRQSEMHLLLQEGDSHLEAGEIDKAVSSYKRMLTAATRSDQVHGVSDWFVPRIRVASRKEDGIEGLLQRSMHEFAQNNFGTAHSLLTQAVKAEPHNRHIRRIMALFYEALGDESRANIEMRFYEDLLRTDPGMKFRAFGESRNEVLVPVDEHTPIPDLYIKRSRNKASLEEEVANIAAFSQELPGMLPRVVRQRFDGQHHELILESLGNSTMLQKSLNGTLSPSDFRAVINLLVKVTAAGERLRKEGKIKVSEPITAPTYVYTIANEPSIADEFRKEGLSIEQPNFDGQHSRYFSHRAYDLFTLRVQHSSGVEFSPEFVEAINAGISTINDGLCADSSLNFVYTDFTHRNIIFDGLSGNLRGKIDWESIKILPVYYELVNILDFFKPNLQTVDYNESIEYLINELGREMQLRINRKMFKLLLHGAAVSRNLELVGYRSRDSALNPENVKAQVFQYHMAKLHLTDALWVPIDRQVKAPLREMQKALEETDIFQDEKQQRELEKHLPVIPLSFAQTLYQLGSRRYWHEASRNLFPEGYSTLFSRKALANLWHDFWRRPSPSPYKGTDISSSDPVFATLEVAVVGVPLMALTVLSYSLASYVAIQKLIPSLPPLPEGMLPF